MTTWLGTTEIEKKDKQANITRKGCSSEEKMTKSLKNIVNVQYEIRYLPQILAFKPRFLDF